MRQMFQIRLFCCLKQATVEDSLLLGRWGSSSFMFYGQFFIEGYCFSQNHFSRPVFSKKPKASPLAGAVNPNLTDGRESESSMWVNGGDPGSLCSFPRLPNTQVRSWKPQQQHRLNKVVTRKEAMDNSLMVFICLVVFFVGHTVCPQGLLLTLSSGYIYSLAGDKGPCGVISRIRPRWA